MTKKSTWIVLCLWALAPVALVAACYGALPDRVPTHWGLDGTVTYGPKALLWLFALLSPALTALLRLLPRLWTPEGEITPASSAATMASARPCCCSC